MSGDLDDLLRERARDGGEPVEGGTVLLALALAVLIVIGIVAALL